MLNLLPEVSTLPTVVAIKTCESGDITWSKDHVGFIIRAPHDKLASCLMWCPWVFCKWRYNVFKLPCDLTKPAHWGIMWIHGCELLAVCHHPDKFGGHKNCDSGDIKYLICHITSQNQVFEESCNSMSGSSSLYVLHVTTQSSWWP